MKLQDTIFLIILIALLYKRKPAIFVGTGLFFLIISIPLFHFWIFFTAQRLVVYSYLLFLIAAVILIIKKLK